MRFLEIRQTAFRNLRTLETPLGGLRIFIHGPNGNGKTNLLEALGFITAGRSFRTPDRRNLVAWGSRQAGILYRIDHETLGGCRVEATIEAGRTRFTLDDTPTTRLGDHMGLFPTVTLAPNDIQVLRGAPSGRRRLLDMAASSAIPGYLRALVGYHKALDARNLLLKRQAHAHERMPFERMMAETATVLAPMRRKAVEDLDSRLAEICALMQLDHAKPGLILDADDAPADAEAHLRLLADALQRDQILGSTSRGPHRDDLGFRLFGRDARESGSEGQQRTLVIALRLAEARWLHDRTGVRPPILADDILGELDPGRRAAFWDMLPPDWQVVATGTTPPDADAGSWMRINVIDGNTVAGG